MRVTEAEVRQPNPVPWVERVYTMLPMAPVWVGVGIASVLLAFFIWAAWAFGGLETVQAGEAELWEYREVRIALVVALLAGYLPTARRYGALEARQNLDDLLPLIGAAFPDWDATRRRFLTFEGQGGRVASALGVLIAPVTALVLDRDPSLYLQRDYWNPETGFAWLVGSLVGWSLGIFVYETLVYARRFSDLAGQIGKIDLLDLSVLLPFARQGLRSALLWLVLISIVSLNAVDFVWFVAITLLALVGAAAALMLPVRGVHRCLRKAKQAELEKVNAAIRGDSGQLASSAIGARRDSPGLSDLLAYRGFVESVREWPFDSPTLLRFILYLAIPLGSWLGGAFVERILSAALD